MWNKKGTKYRDPLGDSKIKGIILVYVYPRAERISLLDRTARLIRIIRSQEILEGDDGRLNTEVIVRGIVVPGYSYVNLDQTFHEGIKRRRAVGLEEVEEWIGRKSAYEYLHEVIISSPEESRISAGEFSTCYFAPRHSASLYKPLFFPLAPRQLNYVPRVDPAWLGFRLGRAILCLSSVLLRSFVYFYYVESI